MAETDVHIRTLIDLREALRKYFRDHPQVYVAANLLLYYEEGNAAVCVTPDVFVVRGVPKHDRRTYKPWEEGRPPAVVIEITSRSSRLEDQGTTRPRMRCWASRSIFSTDSLYEYLHPFLQGYRLQQEDYQRLPAAQAGSLTSQVLGVELRVEEQQLRLVDAVTGVSLLTPAEAYRRLRGSAAEEGAAVAARGAVTGRRPRLRIVQPPPEDRYVTCVPLVPLEAAAEAVGDPQHLEDDDWERVAVDTRHRLRPGMFVARVVGKSMEPDIPDGSYDLFRAPVTGTRQSKTVLVQLRDVIDPEHGERYTVKRYQGEKVLDGDSWRHTRITLKPINPDSQPIELTGAGGRVAGDGRTRRGARG